MQMRRIFISVTAAFALALAAGVPGVRAQTGQDLPTVAVLDFNGFMMGEGGNSAPLGKAVSAMLTTELTGRAGIRVIERQQLQDLLTEQRLSLSGRVEESTAVEVGKLVGAQYVVFGQVSSVVEQLRMDMRVVNVETSEIPVVSKLTGKTPELLDIVVRLADQVGEKLHLVPPSQRPVIAAIPPKATIEFSRGVDYEDKGEMAKAKEHYNKALEIHPDHRDAKVALQRLETTGGLQ